VTGNQTPPEQAPALDLAALGRIAVETTADAILLLDEEARILFANSATSRLFRYAPAELIGLPLTTLIPQASGECGVVELVGLGKNGEQLPVELTVRAHPERVSQETNNASDGSGDQPSIRSWRPGAVTAGRPEPDHERCRGHDPRRGAPQTVDNHDLRGKGSHHRPCSGHGNRNRPPASGTYF
jgi:PAS domain S-box-containing protein